MEPGDGHQRPHGTTGVVAVGGGVKHWDTLNDRIEVLLQLRALPDVPGGALLGASGARLFCGTAPMPLSRLRRRFHQRAVPLRIRNSSFQ